MVAMGGGPDAPHRGDSHKRDVLLCVQPLPEAAVSHVVQEIKEEFPNLEIQYIQQPSFWVKEGDINIPEGMLIHADLFSTTFISTFLLELFIRLFPLHDTAQSLLIGFAHVLELTEAETLKRVTYLTTLSWLPPTISTLPKVNFIQFSSAGINHVNKSPFYTDSKIPLLSANGVHGPQIAEWVIMMDLVHNHKYVDLYEQQRRKEWLQKTGMNMKDRVGKRVGILGYGSIGRQGKSSSSVSLL